MAFDPEIGGKTPETQHPKRPGFLSLHRARRRAKRRDDPAVRRFVGLDGDAHDPGWGPS